MYLPPEEHAANPPETWRVVKAVERCWHVTDRRGVTLSTHTTRRDALAEIEHGFSRRLYDDEGRWMAGEPVRNWRSFAEIVAERERRDAKFPSATPATS